jgi:hypothetical protein
MKIQLFALVLLAGPASLFAGDWGKASVGKAPIEESPDFGASLSTGYVTDYIFKGVRFSRDSVWMEVEYALEGLPVPVSVGTSYLNGINGSAVGAAYDELNAFAKADLGTVAGYALDLAYDYFVFPEFRSNIAPVGSYSEMTLGVDRQFAGIDFRYSLAYGFGDGITPTNGTSPRGWFHDLGASKAFGLTDDLSLMLGAGVAYSDGFWYSTGWNHYYATASLPIRLNSHTTLTPYVGYSGAPDTWVADGLIGANDAQSDILHGGVTLSVSF